MNCEPPGHGNPTILWFTPLVMFMKLQAVTLFLLLLMISANLAHGGPRSSASYTVATDITDVAGRRTTSVNYTNDGSLGGIAGVSTIASPAETAKQGYIAQLYEVTALQLSASPLTIDETGTRQINGAQLLDDLTTIAVPPGSISWSILSGPLSSISTGGVATAGAVYQNTPASVQGVHGGVTGSLGLTVLNTIADNFGSYGGDGIGDDWQVQFFGLNNPNAAPLLDPDFDGVLNLLEFATALNPNAASIVPMQTVKNGANLEFTYPRATAALAQGLSFIVEWSDTLPGTSWSILGVTETILSDNGTVQQVKATVPAGSNGSRFVHLKVAGPP